MQKKKKIVCLFILVFIMAQTVVLKAHAGIAWVPVSDFYYAHVDECETVGKSYLINSPKGIGTVFDTPKGEKQVAQLQNGRRIYVGYSWKDKEDRVWGLLAINGIVPEGEEWIEEAEGWILMEDLQKTFDESEFRVAYQDTFLPYQEEMKGYVIQDAICLWEYPCSGQMNDTIAEYAAEGEEPSYQFIYQDAEGRRWTYIGYYYIKRGWVCIDDPENANLQGANPLTIQLEEIPKEDLQTENVLSVYNLILENLWIVVVLVLIWSIKRKKEKEY